MEERMIPKVYNPQEVEKKWYDFWLKNKYFHAEVEEDKEPYCIVMPPPNVTGSLHLGHSIDNTIQDILIRWKRMQGYNALWVPGTDHAGIATQAKVEEKLAEEGSSRYDLGRENFLERVWEWKHHYGNRITQQLKSLGVSCDWDRERFTMDEGCSRAVREVFVGLYERGLIYRGNRIINWCPNCKTALSDIEVDHLETEGKLYYIKYPVKDSNEFLRIATTRPETMLGDVAVAVHPEDERYQYLIGKTLLLPLVGREIPVIADEYVDPTFGTGAVKVTPAHDPNDFEMGLRHKLKQIIVIGFDGKMTDEAGDYAGMERYACRKKVIEDLKKQQLLEKIDEHAHAVGHCSRCSNTVEPLISQQWFVKMKPLAEPAIEEVKKGNIRIVPERFTKIYLNWLENIQDWCISRQLWWGHRIPVWYCLDCGETIVSREDLIACTHCDSHNIEQDPDVLDTWFSSGLWPFEVLGWPEDTPELRHFYPTSVLVTGRDILFFWVARMIFTALEFMKEKPFHDVLIHGLILDSQGRKMSKSLGNGVDPLEVIEKFGADTLRFTLVTGNTPGNDMRFYWERIESSRNFANKIWNASRFALMNLTDYSDEPLIYGDESYTLADRWILSRCNQVAGDVTKYLERYDIGEAARTIYEFLWNEVCDWYIELIKPRLYNKEEAVSRKTAQKVLTYVLRNTMILLHPIMPFITEEIWQALPHEGETIMYAPWPQDVPQLRDEEAEEKMEMVMEIIKTIRNVRAEMNVPLGKKVTGVLICDRKKGEVIAKVSQYLRNLAGLESISIGERLELDPNGTVSARAAGVEIYLPLSGLVDIEKEKERLKKELADVRKEIGRSEGLLGNVRFLEKAPETVIQNEKVKYQQYLEKAASIEERIRILEGR
jgi:valyl-tRNA synthetase